MTASIDNHELCASAHLHQDTASVTKWFVADGERVHRFDVVAEMSDSLGTETDVVATTDGYLTQAPPESTYARTGLAGWIMSRPVSDFHQSVNDEQAEVSVIGCEVGYLVTRAVTGSPPPSAARRRGASG